MQANDGRPSVSGVETDIIKGPPVTLTAWWTLAILMVFHLLSIVDRQIITLLVENIKADLGLTDTQMSLILGPAFFLPYSILALPLGWLSDKISRRLVLYFGVTLWALAATSGGLATSFITLLLCRTMVGAGEAALTPSAYSMLADQFPRHRLALATGTFQSALKLGTAIAFGLGAILLVMAADIIEHVPMIGDMKPWQIVLICTGLPGVFLAPLIFTVAEPQRPAPAAGASVGPGLWQFVRANLPMLLLLSFGFGCITAASGALTSWVPSYIDRRFGWSPMQYGPVLGLVSLGASVALIFKGGIMDWLYGRGMNDAHVRFYTWLSIASFPLVVMLFWIPRPLIFLLLYGVLQILTLTFMVFLAPAIQIFTPTELRSQMTALFLFVFSIMGSIGPVSIGVITDFLLRDEQKIGVSLSIAVTTFVTISIVLLRLSLPRLRNAMTPVPSTILHRP